MLSWGFSFRQSDSPALQVEKLNMLRDRLVAQETATTVWPDAFASSRLLGSWDYAPASGGVRRPLQLFGPAADAIASPFVWQTRNAIHYMLDDVVVFTLNDDHTVSILGGLLRSIRTVTASDSYGAPDHTIIANATGGAIVLTLPTLAAGREVVAKKTDASANTVTVSGGANIDGAATKVIAAQYGTLRLIGGAAEWHVI